MITRKATIGCVLLLIVSGCGQMPDRRYETDQTLSFEESQVPITLSSDISSSAAVETNNNDGRRFIRTADLRFRVKDVIKSTYTIEQITASHGGFVTNTNLSSDIDRITQTAVSADSVLETTHFTVINSLVLRVPNTKLDTTLKDLSGIIDFLNYRTINANDVALNIMANELTQKRQTKNEQRVTKAIDNRGKKLKETTTAEESLLSKQEKADEARIANLSLQDQINFSTIKVEIYQRPSIKREVLANNKNIDEYTPGFGTKMNYAAKTGWVILESVVLFLVSIWSVLVAVLFILIICLIYRRSRPRY